MAVNILDALKPDAELHPQFKALISSPLFAPARGMIEELSQGFSDPDGNFTEQFQTFGFDARTFEFFLYAMFLESGHTINRSEARPDFRIDKEGQVAWIEAVTANPSQSGVIKPYAALPPNRTEDELAEYLRHEIAIRIGSPLFSKFKMKYWDLPHVEGKPFILAVQNFESAGSLTISSSSIENYLFGINSNWYHDESGNLIITIENVDEHVLGLKRIPSGFFNQPGAENISGILFCNSGTIAKFNRMGHQGAHYSDSVRMIRWGTCYRYDPNATLPRPFLYEVGDPEEGMETWREGTVFIENPNAIRPIAANWIGAAVEDRFIDGKVVSTFYEEFVPYMSLTENYPGNTSNILIQANVDKLLDILRTQFPI